MDEARVIREWAKNELDVVLPPSFEVLLPKILRGVLSVADRDRASLEDRVGLVMIELSCEQGRHLSDEDVKRLLWRIRKRLQRHRLHREYTTQHLDLVAANEPGSEKQEGRTDRARLLEAIRDHLSVMELAILSMMIDGANAERIQAQLDISRATYYRRLRSIRDKVGKDTKTPNA